MPVRKRVGRYLVPSASSVLVEKVWFDTCTNLQQTREPLGQSTATSVINSHQNECISLMNDLSNGKPSCWPTKNHVNPPTRAQQIITLDFSCPFFWRIIIRRLQVPLRRRSKGPLTSGSEVIGTLSNAPSIICATRNT